MDASETPSMGPRKASQGHVATGGRVGTYSALREASMLHDVTVRHLGTAVARFPECTATEAQALIDHYPLSPGDAINRTSYYVEEVTKA